MIQNIKDFIVSYSSRMLNTLLPTKIRTFLVSMIDPRFKLPQENLEFGVPSPLSYWRVETFHEKEPETLEWIQEFEDQSVLYDIGANIGLYSLYAARQGHSVLAFEPAFMNYYLLNRNIRLNDLDDKVQGFCISCTNKPTMDNLYLPDAEEGTALINFGDNVDANKEPFEEDFAQGSVGLPLDFLVENFDIPYPDYLKIDVDGLEREIIEGARKLLSTGEIRSISVEINENLQRNLEIKTILEGFGFSLQRKEKTFESEYNYHFMSEGE